MQELHMRKPRRRPPVRSRGFTLVEIMVVVIVLAVLAATIIPQFTHTAHDAKVTAAGTTIRVLEGQLEQFYIHMDRYPSSSEGLQVLLTTPADDEENWRGPYIKELRPDPWGQPYIYRSPGTHGSTTFDLWSRGADKQDGGEEKGKDIVNWQEPD